jgi:hypothetical protein
VVRWVRLLIADDAICFAAALTLSLTDFVILAAVA